MLKEALKGAELNISGRGVAGSPKGARPHHILKGEGHHSPRNFLHSLGSQNRPQSRDGSGRMPYGEVRGVLFLRVGWVLWS